jgi:hypothetical protein
MGFVTAVFSHENQKIAVYKQAQVQTSLCRWLPRLYVAVGPEGLRWRG